MPAAIAASIPMARAAALLNDSAQAIYTNTVLLPYIQIAWDEMAELFEENANPMMNETNTTCVVGTTMTDIGGSTGPALPSDLISIQTLYERTNGSSEDWQEMKPCTFLPTFVAKSTSLVYWAWMNQIINFIGATSSRQIRIDYIGLTFATLSGPSSSLTVFNCKNFLAFRTAALAAEFVGEDKERAASCNNFAIMAKDRLLNISIKQQQETPSRRRPFQSTYRSNRGI